MARLSLARIALDRRWRSGAITKQARREGKSPRHVYAGLKSAETRRRRIKQAARVHGARARQRTERRLTKAQKTKRAAKAGAITRTATQVTARSAPSTWQQVIDDYGEPDAWSDYDEYDLEGHHDDPYFGEE